MATPKPAGRRRLASSIESWSFKMPFTITGYTFTTVELLCVAISADGCTGRGEAAGVYYLDENGERMLAEVDRVRAAIEAGAGRVELQSLLPPGGARNALDCALWDLEAKQSGRTIWELTGIGPGVVHSAQTVGLGTPEAMAAAASAIDGRHIKVKLDAESPIERVAAIRAVRPDDEIIVDVNQGWSVNELAEYAPRLAKLGVAMIEQPLPRGSDAELEDFESPLPLCADESCLCVSEFEQAARRYDIINIKLDKTGGLTEALELARMVKARGLELMIGNMMGTSLAMAPGYVVAQLCRYVDLDGALYLEGDRPNGLSWEHGTVSRPRRELWG